ncbi:hypothetical protein V1264_007188 [Littorina saxatilis]|uniref:C2H2-type domain-containing protein n=1 Tax=Littorina saxatilis TaxID=31220 RepID=A0AAN9AVR2_9CAEN
MDAPDPNQCQQCLKRFTARYNLRQHQRQVHQQDRPHLCEICGKTFARLLDLLRHIEIHDNTKRQGRKRKSDQGPRLNQEKRKKKNKPFWERQPQPTQQDNEDLLKLYRDNNHSIKHHRRRGHHQHSYTYQWEDSEIRPDWREDLQDMFDDQQHRFKINLSHGLILKHKENGNLKYFHPSINNEPVFRKPKVINNRDDFNRFLDKLEDKDILEYAKQQRPDSKWGVYGATCTSFVINPVTDFPIGCSNCRIPEEIRNCPGINILNKDENHFFEYNDNLCFFRCLALHQGTLLHSLTNPTKALYNRWRENSDLDDDDDNDFEGITLEEVEAAEMLFQVNVDVFEFSGQLKPYRRSRAQFTNNLMRVLLVDDNHFCFINDIDVATKSFCCEKCGKLWKDKNHMGGLHRHEATCNGGESKHRYPGGVYRPNPSVMELIRLNGIDVSQVEGVREDGHYTFPFFLTYDFESYFSPLEGETTQSTNKTAEHVPMSVSVASNVPGFEAPKCFISNGNTQELIDDMMMYMSAVSDESYSLLQQQFEDVFRQLSEREATSPTTTTRRHSKCVSGLPADTLRKKLNSYLRELPVVGFNSAKYDTQVIKPHLFVNLTSPQEDDDDDDDDAEGKVETNIKYVIKRNNAFLCLATRKLKFLDVINFLAPGFSYAKYLKAYGVEEEKGVFCYEYITSLEQLQETTLPPQEAFYSKLKGKGITNEEYAHCQHIWEEKNMTTLADFLRHYNNKDVVPFVKALTRQMASYTDLGLDMLKDAISIPGLTLKYLFKTISTDVCFPLINEKHKALHELLREQMVGGPSLIFSRHLEVGETKVRNDKPVMTVEGFDANGLYCWALKQAMPTDYPIIRSKDNGFQPQSLDPYGVQEREWVEYMAYSLQKHVQHKYNVQQHVLGDRCLPVDGWIAETNTALQYHGCFWHGHSACAKTKGKTHNTVNGKSFQELREKTAENTRYLREEVGVHVIEQWECEWEKRKTEDWEVQDFISNRYKRVDPLTDYPIAKEDIEEAVQKGSLFGLIQCNIEVPDHLQEHFQELQPIFKNTNVSRDDIGDFMRKYCETNNLLRQPRRTLVASYYGERILLATPLLKWYLEHGLVITDVQLVVEYRPMTCFQQFVDTVAAARREGDSDPSKTIVADTFKLLGNSAYGKTLTNLAKHTDVVYTDDETTIKKLINSNRFRKLTHLTDDLVEVESTKATVRWNLPNVIGFFVYQYAKLRMLDFHYEVIDKFMDRSDYQLAEMDTDSLYMALSTPTLEDAVRPDMREEFYRKYHMWFPASACDTHREDFVRTKLNNQQWLPHPCCEARRKFDKRTPGLFKLEYKGDSIVALCSKTYICSSKDGPDKVSCKGLMKNINPLDKQQYLNVLKTQTPDGGENRGFRSDGKRVYTYTQKRQSLSFLYIKRRVCDDGVTTLPFLK